MLNLSAGPREGPGPEEDDTVHPSFVVALVNLNLGEEAPLVGLYPPSDYQGARNQGRPSHSIFRHAFEDTIVSRISRGSVTSAFG